MFTTPVAWATFNLSVLFTLTGLSHSPRPEKAELSFSMSDESSYSEYVKNIDALLKSYNKENQEDNIKFEDCGGTISFIHLNKPKLLVLLLKG